MLAKKQNHVRTLMLVESLTAIELQRPAGCFFRLQMSQQRHCPL